MNCTKCGERISPGPNSIERIRRGEVEYRHRICQRRLKRKKETKYQLSKPKKRGWDKAREVALTTRSEISGYTFATIKSSRRTQYVNRIIDHIVPERLAVETGKDPHARINLICITSEEHGRKRAAEDKLLKNGDMLTYLEQLAYQGWPADRVHAALRFYELPHGIYCQECKKAAELQDGTT